MPPIAYLFLTILAFFLVTLIIPKISIPLFGNNINPVLENMSIGNRVLITESATGDKKQAVESFTTKDYTQAENQFKKSLLANPNDPESVIYLNDTQAIKNYLKLAVVVPIKSNRNVAEEMLRGVASAQTEINQKGGINGKKLLVQIVDDQNNPDIAKQVAQELLKDKEILAVIGSNASNPSLAAAPIYKQANLVMITPTSFSDTISGLAWRIVPSTKISGQILADYVVNKAKKTKLAICYDSSAIDTISFKDEFVSALLGKKATIIPLVCDVSKPNFNPTTLINEAIHQGADGLFAVSHIDHITEKIMPLAIANKGRLALFSSPTMYNIQTLRAGETFKGLILVTPYHPQINPSFAAKMEEEWKGRVSWRTATTFDAIKVIITALQQSQTKEGIKQILLNPSFSVEGATGTVKFDSTTGDRMGKPVIVQVQSNGLGNYDFMMLP